MDVDDEPVRVGQEESRILDHFVQLQHHAGQSALVLRHADLVQESAINVEAFAHQFGREASVIQVEEDAVGIGDTPGLVLDLFFQVDGDPRVVRRGPLPDTGDQGQPARRLCGVRIADLPDIAFLRLPGRLGAGLFGLDLSQRIACVVGQTAARVALQELLESGLGVFVVFEVIAVDLPDGEQGLNPAPAAGILAAQELVLCDRGLGNLGIAQGAAHLRQQSGHGSHAGVGFAGDGRGVVHAAVSIDHPLIFAPGALACRTPVE